MSRTTRSSALRPMMGAGLLITAGFAVPAAAHAQSGAEGALLNRLAPTVFIPNAFTSGVVLSYGALTEAVSGERALLAPNAVIEGHDPATPAGEGAPLSVDGAYALLGRSGPLDRGRRTQP